MRHLSVAERGRMDGFSNHILPIADIRHLRIRNLGYFTLTRNNHDRPRLIRSVNSYPIESSADSFREMASYSEKIGIKASCHHGIDGLKPFLPEDHQWSFPSIKQLPQGRRNPDREIS